MASGGISLQEAASGSPLSASPEPGQLLGLDAVDLEQVRASPQLSRRAKDESDLENEIESEDDSENYKLHSPWTLWFDRSPRGSSAQDYFANLRSIFTVKTIKAFWRVVNNLRPVEQLMERESYHLMRWDHGNDRERRPVWEDENNANGGIWSFKIRKEDTAMIWQELLLAAIGEQFSENVTEGDDVCGVSVRIRGFDQNVIQIWNMDSELHSKTTVISKVKELVPQIEINEFYQSNKSKMRDSLMRPHTYHRGLSPPPPMQGRYPAPMPFQPPMYMPPGPPMYHPRPPHPHHFQPRYRHPPPHSYSPSHFPPSRLPYPAP